VTLARWLLWLLLVGGPGGCLCEREPPRREEPRALAEAATPAAAERPRAPDKIDVPDRLVAIGDLHGDLAATRAALRLAGAIDRQDDWVGGNLVVVQTGDQIDRGNDEPEVLALFDALAEKAKANGGAVISLLGNHEVMNVQGDFRYVTEEGFVDFASYASSARDPALLTQVTPGMRGRAAAFLPGGPIARKLAERPLVAIVGDSLFVHGGILPSHTSYGLRRANDQTRAWMLAELGRIPPILDGDEAPVWTRAFADPEPPPRACEALGKVLEELSIARMVVGHTVQKDGVRPGCGERVWRIDVGLAKHYGGELAVLEIQGKRVRQLDAQDR
jgi:hypothetical protein